MALSLIVYRHGPASQFKETSRLFFYVGGVAALTLIINAPTSQALLRYLDLLDNDSTEKSLILAQITQKLRKHMRKVLADLASEFQFTAEELQEVAQCCSLLNESDATEVVSSLHDTHASGHSVMPGANIELRELSTDRAGADRNAADDVEEGGPRMSTFSVNFEVSYFFQ